jgi:excisionase family DNA binding protein
MAGECEGWARVAERSVEGSQTEKRLSSDSATREAIERLALSVKDAARLLGLGRSTIYRLIGEGELQTIKLGNRTLIKMASLRSLIDDQK